MNTIRFRFLLALVGAALLASTGLAQTTITAPGSDPWRRAGDREFTLGGSGVSNKKFNDSSGGVNFSLGWYFNDTQEVLLRQDINYTNPRNADHAWNGATRLVFDQHFPVRGPVRPFIGVSLGGIYGRHVRDTFAGGLEAGLKYYVQPKTFIYALAQYDWFFRHRHDFDRGFNDGQYTWGVGIGFNF